MTAGLCHQSSCVSEIETENVARQYLQAAADEGRSPRGLAAGKDAACPRMVNMGFSPPSTEFARSGIPYTFIRARCFYIQGMLECSGNVLKKQVWSRRTVVTDARYHCIHANCMVGSLPERTGILSLQWYGKGRGSSQGGLRGALSLFGLFTPRSYRPVDQT